MIATKLFHTHPLPSEIVAWGGAMWSKRMVDLGVHAFRFGPYWDRIYKGGGKYDWSEYDAALEMIHASGGHVYYNPQGIPPEFAQSTRCYVSGVLEEGGVLEWVPGTKDNSTRYTTNPTIRAQCIPPPTPDPNALADFAQMSYERYGSMTALDGDPFIMLWGWGNEPDDLNTSTGQTKLIQPYQQVAGFVYTTQHVPFARGIRRANPAAPIAASEAATHGFAAYILSLDSVAPERMIDVSSVHLYPDPGSGGFPLGALRKIDGQEGSYAAWMSGMLYGRLEMCGEVGLSLTDDDPIAVLPYLRSIFGPGKYNRFTYFTFMLLDSLVFKRSSSGGRTTEPNLLYDEVRLIVRGGSSLHRGVEHQ